jgi:hypothetical protein
MTTHRAYITGALAFGKALKHPPFLTHFTVGEFHDQVDAKWIVIRRSLWGHNDMPCGWPASGRPIGHPGSGSSQGVFGGLSYYQLLMLSSNIIFQHCSPDHVINLCR